VEDYRRSVIVFPFSVNVTEEAGEEEEITIVI
jgi:hypothetical protein